MEESSVGNIRWLAECRTGTAGVGGKAAGLGEMLSLGLRVPPGFVITRRAYEEFVAVAGLGPLLAELAAAANEPQACNAPADALRKRIESTPAPDFLAAAILDAYDALARSCGMARVSVAVRSSASTEDLPGASFAGQQDTYLGVTRETLLDAVHKCWASLFSEPAIAYRSQMGYPLAEVWSAIVVQKLVAARTSGVMFTINPVTGNPFEMVIEANWGLGESVVAGMVVPDRFVVLKSGGVAHRELGVKTQAAVVGLGGHRMIDLPPERQSVPCLDDAEIEELAGLGRLMEKHYGEPRDVEWSVDSELPFPDSVILLQTRPVTTTGLHQWHRSPDRSVTDHILDMLIGKRSEDPGRPESGL